MQPEDDFRHEAIEQSLAQLSVLFAGFHGMLHGKQRFQAVKIEELRSEMVTLLTRFIEQTPVEPIPEHLQGILDATLKRQSTRQEYIGHQRLMFERIGFHLPRKPD